MPNFLTQGGEAIYLKKIFTPGCLGYIFLEYSSPDNAEKAVAGMDNYKLDKQHTFLVNLFSGISFSFTQNHLNCDANLEFELTFCVIDVAY